MKSFVRYSPSEFSTVTHIPPRFPIGSMEAMKRFLYLSSISGLYRSFLCCTENGLKNAVAKNQITDQLKKTLELLQENKELKNKLEIQNNKINELKNYFKSFFLDF